MWMTNLIGREWIGGKLRKMERGSGEEEVEGVEEGGRGEWRRGEEGSGGGGKREVEEEGRREWRRRAIRVMGYDYD